MREFMDQGKILVFSSHSLSLLTEYCNRTVWMNRGRIIEDGLTPQVVNAYKNHALGRSTMLPEPVAAA
jgi:lipopolysaccharide transport system ATP-binding protein